MTSSKGLETGAKRWLEICRENGVPVREDFRTEAQYQRAMVEWMDIKDAKALAEELGVG